MFTKVEIANISGDVALSVEGIEYEILTDSKAECLLLDQVVKQLKLSRFQHAYCVINSEIIYLKVINSNLEIFDESVRFKYSAKKIININDIYLHHKLLLILSKSDYSSELYVKWGRKNELFFNTSKASNFNVDVDVLMQKLMPNSSEELTLSSRFYVLLNDSFLDKLKTYFTFWKQTNNVELNIPSWYHSLYKTSETV
ncbi:MAG: hypothetical protein AB8B72_11395 [Crocinitomicaceae bacterium]